MSDTSHLYRQLRHAAHDVLVTMTERGTPTERSLGKLRQSLDDIERAEFQILVGALGSIREITHALLLHGKAAAHRSDAHGGSVMLVSDRHAELQEIADRALRAVTSSPHLGEAPTCPCADDAR